MLLLRYSGVSLLLIPITAVVLSLTFRQYLPWHVIAIVIVISLIISESMMRALTDFLLPGNERTWMLWLITASQNSQSTQSPFDAIPATDEYRVFLNRMKHMPTLRVVVAETLAKVQ